MNKLVKFFTNDDGYPCSPVWHLIDPSRTPGNMTLCTGEFFGVGESAVVFETKTMRRGGITCADCLDKLVAYKAVRM
jgi:hypothetical protein